MVYLLVIISSLFMVKQAETHLIKRNHYRNRLNIGHLYLAFAGMIPCVLAGLRADTVGTDVQIYAVKTMEEAVKSHSFAYMSRIDVTYTEVLYRVLAFVVSRVFVDTGWLLFYTEMIIIANVIIAIYLFRNDISMPKAYAVFMFMFYHVTFNVMRQSIAMALLLVMFYYLKEKKYIKYWLLALVAFGFHSFSILISALLFVFFIFEKFYRKGWQKSALATVGLIIIVSFKYLSNSVYVFLLKALPRYARYISDLDGEKKSLFIILLSPAFWMSIVLFIVSSIAVKKSNMLKGYLNVIYVLLLIGFACTVIQIYIGIAYRIGVYLKVFLVIFAPHYFKYKSYISSRQKGMIYYCLLFSYFMCDCMLSSHSSTRELLFRI